MKIIFYNMAYGTGMDGNWKNYVRKTWRFFWLPFDIMRDMVQTLKNENPDVICLAEVDGGSFRARFRCQAREMAQKLKLGFVQTASKYHPKSIWRWMHMVRKHHDAILSRRKGEFRMHHLKSGMKKLVQEYIVDGVSIFTVHLALLSKKVRQKQLKELAGILKECPRPHILCGDFNTLSGIEELTEFIKETKLQHLIQAPSFPSIKPYRYLDHFFASPDIKIRRAGTIPVTHSDHLPVFVELA